MKYSDSAASLSVSDVDPITVAAVGDLLLGDSATSVGFGFRSRYPGQEIAYACEDIHPFLESADIAFGNLECTLSLANVKQGSWRSTQLRGTPSYATALRTAGFNLLNVANNHATQHGDATFFDTIAILREAGIECCGVRGADGWTSEPVTLGIRGKSVGVLGYCLRPRQYSTHEPPYAEGTEDEIRADVRRMKANSERVVVSLHWGEEFVAEPSETEVAFAQSVVDAGADLILGHHPHVARPVEIYRGRAIAYSLGNCLADMVWLRSLRQGVLLNATMSSGADAEVSVGLIPLEIDDAFAPKRKAPNASWARVRDRVQGLPPTDYSAAVAQTIREQQLASYTYAARNVARFPPRILAQLVGVTLRNKLGALMRR
jgi:poly-gamma-glutamate synthesis protein (capsule biosynthesis protein)